MSRAASDTDDHTPRPDADAPPPSGGHLMPAEAAHHARAYSAADLRTFHCKRPEDVVEGQNMQVGNAVSAEGVGESLEMTSGAFVTSSHASPPRSTHALRLLLPHRSPVLLAPALFSFSLSSCYTSALFTRRPCAHPTHSPLIIIWHVIACLCFVVRALATGWSPNCIAHGDVVAPPIPPPPPSTLWFSLRKLCAGAMSSGGGELLARAIIHGDAGRVRQDIFYDLPRTPQ
ncbi:hypothetical protein B0H17DRAFT_1205716 [Mycena rosella]|uniref:Uncharacterized protein n=1 Tax=Mycena rosella TaxID=1033263 RepID=A0AAD7D6Q8_MYCRO|nr:hypothetical protein B0H17DRAFT_1205716 [Mycena rosella]